MTTPEAATVRLRNGASVRIRPIRPDDEPRLFALYDRLGLETAFQRFFTVMRSLPPEWAHYFAHVDGVWRVAVVAERDGADGEPVLVGIFGHEGGELAVSRRRPLPVRDTLVERGSFAISRGLPRSESDGLLAGLEAVLPGAGWQRCCPHFMRGLLARHTRIVRQQVEQGVAEIVFCRRAAAPADAA